MANAPADNNRFKPGQEVIVPVHVSLLKNPSELPWPQSWIPLRGRITKRGRIAGCFTNYILVSGNEEYQDEPFNIVVLDDLVQPWIPLDDLTEAKSFKRIVDRRHHGHNRGQIRCPMTCAAKSDYMVQWEDAEESRSWVPDCDISPEAIVKFEVQEQYANQVVNQVATYFYDRMKDINPSDQDALAAVLNTITLNRVQHVCHHRLRAKSTPKIVKRSGISCWTRVRLGGGRNSA
jgi:hypothetical protein